MKQARKYTRLNSIFLSIILLDIDDMIEKVKDI